MHQYRGFLFRCFVQESGADPFVVFDEIVDFFDESVEFSRWTDARAQMCCIPDCFMKQIVNAHAPTRYLTGRCCSRLKHCQRSGHLLRLKSSHLFYTCSEYFLIAVLFFFSISTYSMFLNYIRIQRVLFIAACSTRDFWRLG